MSFMNRSQLSLLLAVRQCYRIEQRFSISVPHQILSILCWSFLRYSFATLLGILRVVTFLSFLREVSFLRDCILTAQQSGQRGLVTQRTYV